MKFFLEASFCATFDVSACLLWHTWLASLCSLAGEDTVKPWRVTPWLSKWQLVGAGFGFGDFPCRFGQSDDFRRPPTKMVAIMDAEKHQKVTTNTFLAKNHQVPSPLEGNWTKTWVGVCKLNHSSSNSFLLSRWFRVAPD